MSEVNIVNRLTVLRVSGSATPKLFFSKETDVVKPIHVVVRILMKKEIEKNKMLDL